MLDLPATTVDSLARQTLRDRILGALVGSALGDAIGLYTEFLSSERAWKAYPSGKFTLHPTPTRFERDFHRLKHCPGQWTDDTDHALLILLSFLHNRTLDTADVAKRLHVWVEQGLRALDTPPLGLGATVGAIVRDPNFLMNPEAAAHDRWKKSDYQIAPNGSLMRTHPVGLICLFKTQEETFELAARYSRITHVDPRCVVSCMIASALVRALVRGDVVNEGGIDSIVDEAVAAYPTLAATFRKEGPNQDGEPDLDIEELKRHVNAPDLESLQLDGQGIGYVYKALGTGILLLRLAMRDLAAKDSLDTATQLFEPLITKLTMAGGDADTNACVAGSFLGAFLGYKALPPHWVQGIQYREWLVLMGEDLCLVLGATEGPYTPKADTAIDGGRGLLDKNQIDGMYMHLQARMATENRAFIDAEEAEAKRRGKPSIWQTMFGGGAAYRQSIKERKS